MINYLSNNTDLYTSFGTNKASFSCLHYYDVYFLYKFRKKDELYIGVFESFYVYRTVAYAKRPISCYE